MRIDGSRIVITGASSGIGQSLSWITAGKGGSLVLASRNVDWLRAMASQIKKVFPETPEPLALRCDVADRRNVHSLIDTATRRLGGIDILINNAGISVYGDMERTSVEDFERLFDVNFFGPLYGMLEVIPQMKAKNHGIIVNIASLAAIHGVPYLGAYGASKAALAVLGQSLRAELSEYGIKIINVYPSYTRTNIFEREKKVGGARRPDTYYAPAVNVAGAVAKAIETEKPELVLSLEGRAMALVKGVLPKLVANAMERIASSLREREQVCHG